MGVSEVMQAISEGRVPDGYMVVMTSHGSSEVRLYGVNQMGCIIPIERIEDFIKELETSCTDPETLYEFQAGDQVIEIPGYKVPKIALYLRRARDVGVELREYRQVF